MAENPSVQPSSELATTATADPSVDPPNITDSISSSLSGLMRGELSGAGETLVMKVIVPAVTALVLLVVTYFVAKLISRWVATALCKRVDQTLGKFAGKLTFYAVVSIAGLAILQTAGIGITSFAALMAAAGFAIGLAFQGTLSNFAAGVLLLVFRPFKVGDVVSAGGVTGKVDEVDLFTTTFDTPDNRRLIIPNSAIAGTTIENISYHAQRRVEVEVGVSYSASISKTRQVLNSAAQGLADLMVEGEGRGYQVVLANLGASSVDWKVRFWTAKENYFPVQEALTAEIKTQLDEFGIDIPYPQMELHFADPAAPQDLLERVDEPESADSDQEQAEIPSIRIPNTKARNRVRPRARSRSENV